MPRTITGIDLTKDLVLIHYVDSEDEKIDEQIAAVKWKANPGLRKVVQAFAEVVSNYILIGNVNVEKLNSGELENLFRDLLSDNENTD